MEIIAKDCRAEGGENSKYFSFSFLPLVVTLQWLLDQLLILALGNIIPVFPLCLLPMNDSVLLLLTLILPSPV